LNIVEGAVVESKLDKHASKGTVIAVDATHGSILVQYDGSPAGTAEWLPQERCRVVSSPAQSPGDASPSPAE
jgi:hypothetical protein